MQPWAPGLGLAGVVGYGGPAPTTVDEASMERSKSFVKALQELGIGEKQKQMENLPVKQKLGPHLGVGTWNTGPAFFQFLVLDNLKDYAVRALVNVVDHLGTVAYKLTDLYEQQATEVSTLEMKVACLNQQVLTCQTYMEKEGLRQQQMTGTTTRHHKHYIVPHLASKRMHAFSEMQTDVDIDSRPRPYPAAKSLFWHLASEKNSKSNGAHQSEFVLEETKATKPASRGKESLASPLPKHLQSNLVSSNIVMHNVGVKDQHGVRHLSSFSSFDNPRGRQIQKAPLRTKSMLAALFLKHKSGKMKNVSVR